MTPHQRLTNWAQSVQEHRIPRYNELPNIDLYMDQVVAVIDDYLNVYMRNAEEQRLTPAMINNYVKLKLLPAPVKKRYNRTHLCHLIIICILKPVLAIPEIHELICAQLEHSDIRDVYNAFCDMHEESIRTMLAHLDLPKAADAAAAPNAALHIAVHANASKMIAERLIDAQKPDDAPEQDKKEKKK